MVINGPIKVTIPTSAFKIIKWGSQVSQYITFCAMIFAENGTNVDLEFQVFGTGSEIDIESPGKNYLDTVFDGPYVWHVFQIKEEIQT